MNENGMKKKKNLRTLLYVKREREIEERGLLPSPSWWVMDELN